MQALILAAGIGSRLGGAVPKPLLQIAGRLLVVRLIEQFRSCNIGAITVVLGHERNQVAAALKGHDVELAFNPVYDRSDNMYSFWVGSDGLRDDCIVGHADLIIEDELLQKVVGTKADIVLPMDRSTLDEESMKIELIGGQVVNIGKAIPRDHAAGESIPLIKFSAAAVKALRAAAGEIIGAGHLKRHLEDGILSMIQKGGLQISVLDVTGHRWAEIDTPADLERARRLFLKPGK
jgi:choline kinase